MLRRAQRPGGLREFAQYLIHTNLTGCFNCLEIARRAKADFLFVSTSRVYPVRLLNQLAYVEAETRFELAANQELPGASQHGVAEEFPLDGTRSLYGMTTGCGVMIEEYSEAYGFRYIVDRCGLLTGPWQLARSDQGVIAQWVAWHHFGKPLRYIGFGGSGSRSEISCMSMISASWCRTRSRTSTILRRRWNVGGGAANSLSLRETTALCREVTGRTVNVAATDENRPVDLRLVHHGSSRRLRGPRVGSPARRAAHGQRYRGVDRRTPRGDERDRVRLAVGRRRYPVRLHDFPDDPGQVIFQLPVREVLVDLAQV